MNTSEIFLVAMLLIFALPFLVWRLGRTEYYAPLVVVQIVTGIVLGPGILGAVFPEYYRFVFNPAVVQSLNGIAWWAVMCFVLLAGIELDLKHAWEHRRESSTAAAENMAGEPADSLSAVHCGLSRASALRLPSLSRCSLRSVICMSATQSR